MRNSAGLRIVENPGEGLRTGAQRPVVREVLRIASVDDDARYEFGDVSASGERFPPMPGPVSSLDGAR